MNELIEDLENMSAAGTAIGARAARERVAKEKPGAEEKPLRVGIVGMGKMGRIRANVVRSRPDMELVAIGDIDPSAAADFPGMVFYGDYRQLLERDLDTVFVCTFNDVAPEVIIAALDKNIHVFCEKPPGRCVEDVERIMAAEARNPGLKLQFGFNHRYHPALRKARIKPRSSSPPPTTLRPVWQALRVTNEA